MPELWHLAERSHWDGARAGGTYERSTRGASLAEVGFVHCSRPEQLPGVAAAFYADVDADQLVLLRIDPGLVPAEVRVEDGFPHVYGPIPVAAVTAAEPVTRTPDGTLVLPAEAAPNGDAAPPGGATSPGRCPTGTTWPPRPGPSCR